MRKIGTCWKWPLCHSTRIRLRPRPGQATLVIAHPDQARDRLRLGIARKLRIGFQ